MLLPSARTATPIDILNFAFDPMPSTFPSVPHRPASVETTPVEVTMRIQWLLASAIKKSPSTLVAIREGALNLAFIPIPSAYPATPLPASVVAFQ